METKKMHWTQTPEGKMKMARAQEKSWKTRRSSSKAERLIKKKVGKTAGPNRAAMYERIAKMAAAAGEIPQLCQAVSHAMFMEMWMGGGK